MLIVNGSVQWKQRQQASHHHFVSFQSVFSNGCFNLNPFSNKEKFLLKVKEPKTIQSKAHRTWTQHILTITSTPDTTDQDYFIVKVEVHSDQTLAIDDIVFRSGCWIKKDHDDGGDSTVLIVVICVLVAFGLIGLIGFAMIKYFRK